MLVLFAFAGDVIKAFLGKPQKFFSINLQVMGLYDGGIDLVPEFFEPDLFA
jgi:hypothetical protein